MAENDRPIIRTTTQSREGVTGHNVRYVLGISTGCGIVLLGLLWWYFFG